MKRILKYAFYLLAAALVLMLADVAICFIYPDVSFLKKHNPEKTSFMKYRERQWEKKGLDKKIIRKWVKFKNISPYAVKAVIIAEDDKFWRHEGFDFTAMEKAIKKDIEKRKFKVGGSTISQQLAKNLFLTPAKNPIRKIKEAIYTWRLERALSKKRILELYLNVAEWGDALFGIEAASMRYYGKSAYSLRPLEAANLAAVLPNPVRYNPNGRSRYLRNRSAIIYRIMVRRGIVIEEYEEVMKEPEPLIKEIPEDVPAEEKGTAADTSGIPASVENAGRGIEENQIQTDTTVDDAPVENRESN